MIQFVRRELNDDVYVTGCESRHASGRQLGFAELFGEAAGEFMADGWTGIKLSRNILRNAFLFFNIHPEEKPRSSRSGVFVLHYGILTVHTQEIWCRNGRNNIYGIAYIPEADKPVPLIIFSHELGNSHTSGIHYAQQLAEAGNNMQHRKMCRQK